MNMAGSGLRYTGIYTVGSPRLGGKWGEVARVLSEELHQSGNTALITSYFSGQFGNLGTAMLFHLLLKIRQIQL